MTSKRLALRVVAEDGCPLFRVGDQMVLDLPAVDAASSAAVCALTVAELLAASDRAACEGTTAPWVSGHLACPRREAPVRFEVELLPPRIAPAPVYSGADADLGAAITFFSEVPIFRGLPPAALTELAQRIRLEHFEDGALILQKGHPGRGVFVIRRGNVEVVGFAEREVSAVVSRLRAKDCFGEMSILTSSPVAASVVARGPVGLYVLPPEEFDFLLRENPFIAARFVRLMASRVLSANFLLARQGAKSFSGKLSVMSPVTVLQILADARRSGTLHLEAAGRKAELGFHDGELFEARCGALSGEDAVYSVLGWESGEFWLEASPVPATDHIQLGVMSLLLEGMRRLDEARR